MTNANTIKHCRADPVSVTWKKWIHVFLTCLSSTVAPLPMSKATLTGANAGCNFRTWNQQWTKTQWCIQGKCQERRWQKIKTLQLTVSGSSPFSAAASACCRLWWAAGVSWTERPLRHGPCSRLQRQHEEPTYDHLDTETQWTPPVITLKKSNNSCELYK